MNNTTTQSGRETWTLTIRYKDGEMFGVYRYSSEERANIADQGTDLKRFVSTIEKE
jgi:hypothetical protein